MLHNKCILLLNFPHIPRTIINRIDVTLKLLNRYSSKNFPPLHQYIKMAVFINATLLHSPLSPKSPLRKIIRIYDDNGTIIRNRAIQKIHMYENRDTNHTRYGNLC